MKSSDQSKVALLVFLVQVWSLGGAAVAELRKLNSAANRCPPLKVRTTEAKVEKLRTRGCCFLESSVRSSELRINAQYHVLRLERDSSSELTQSHSLHSFQIILTTI